MQPQTTLKVKTHNTNEFRQDYEWLFDKQVGVLGGEGDDASTCVISGGESPGESASVTLQDEVLRRAESGQFAEVIQDFENLSQEQYNMWVYAPIPLVHESGNKFYLSSGGDLYVYAGGVDSENRFYVCTLQRPE